MLLTIRTTHEPATDLGYLLGKHPERFQTKSLAFGDAHVFYPEANEKACTAALLLEINSIKLQKNRNQQFSESFRLANYVNDRPYVASSFLSTAIAKVLGSALNGNCKDRPDLVDQAIPLEINLTSLPVRGGKEILHRLFEPLGYEVKAENSTLDEAFPEWGESPYYQVQLKIDSPLRLVLSHLYVLIPALDNKKHYFVSEAEIQKLIEKGEEWLKDHPEKDMITKRYLRYRGSFVRSALDQLVNEEASPQKTTENQEETLEKPMNLHALRHQRVIEELKKLEVKSIIDLGCGSGKLLKQLVKERQFQKITGMDISYKSVEVAHKRLYLRDAGPKMKERLSIFHGSLTYCDQRLKGYDAAALVEVIEHLDEPRLEALEKVVFQYAQPKVVAVTTPNREYNVLFEGLPEGQFRHNDHRFEWTRAEFEEWANSVANDHGYTTQFFPLGPVDENHGAPSQMVIFKLTE